MRFHQGLLREVLCPQSAARAAFNILQAAPDDMLYARSKRCVGQRDAKRPLGLTWRRYRCHGWCHQKSAVRSAHGRGKLRLMAGLQWRNDDLGAALG